MWFVALLRGRLALRLQVRARQPAAVAFRGLAPRPGRLAGGVQLRRQRAPGGGVALAAGHRLRRRVLLRPPLQQPGAWRVAQGLRRRRSSSCRRCRSPTTPSTRTGSISSTRPISPSSCRGCAASSTSPTRRGATASWRTSPRASPGTAGRGSGPSRRRLRDFYAVQVEQPTGELLLTPRTLDRPVLLRPEREVEQPRVPDGLHSPDRATGAKSMAGLLTGTFPAGIPACRPPGR